MNMKWSDADMLRVLEDEAEGIAAGATGNSLGVSRSAVMAVRKRVRDACAEHSNTGDGSLPPRWWQAGLSARKATRSRRPQKVASVGTES